MSIPAAISGLRAEIDTVGDGTGWTDITTKTYSRDGYTITRGRRNEGATADASSATLTINNRDGAFSPRNPTGTYYGKIGRNTPLRISEALASTYLDVTAVTSAGATAPDTAGLSITGDLDLRIDLTLWSWRQNTDLIGKYDIPGNQRSYALVMTSAGLLRFLWSVAGTVGISVYATVPVPVPSSGRKALRVTLDVDNGAAGNTVTFYTSDTINGSWTQLGDAVVSAGTTSIYDSTSPLYIGDIAGAGTQYTQPAPMRVYAAKVLSGIAGTTKASPDFTAQSDGTTSFVDAQSNTWTVQTGASIVGRDWRFYGEIPAWPPTWDKSGRDVWVPVAAAGILRRLGQGSSPLKSPYYRACTSTVAPVTGLLAYWPCEDDASATSIASGLPGGAPAGFTPGLTLASDTTTFACATQLPVMGSAIITGLVPGYTTTHDWQVRALLAIPSTGTLDGSIVFRAFCQSGSIRRWDLIYHTGSGGTLTMTGYDAAGSSVTTSGAIGFLIDGAHVRVSMSVSNSGGTITYGAATLAPGDAIGATWSGSVAGTSETITAIQVGAGATALDGVTIGHITVQDAITSIFDLSDMLDGYAGETAGARFARLCGEESITYRVLGDTTSSVAMGAQGGATLLTLLRDCEAADGGILYEPRDFFGLAYRCGNSLYTQGVGLALNYAAADLSAITPTDDDLNTVNDVTAQRPSGSSYRTTLATGAMSTLPPPNGVGQYDTSVSTNVATDDQLRDEAGWRLHLGTVDEARYPTLGVNLARTNFVGSATLTAQATALDVGDRVTVDNPPAWVAPDQINQLVVGFTEVLNTFERELTMVCAPASPYNVGVYDGTSSGYDTDGCVFASNASSGTTSFSVTNTGQTWWTHDDGDVALRVGGERVTLTAVAGTGTSQTLTVTRAVNGVVKAHTAGDAISLWAPTYYGL